MSPNKNTGKLKWKYESISKPIHPAAPMVASNCKPRLLYFKNLLSGSSGMVIKKKPQVIHLRFSYHDYIILVESGFLRV